MEVDVFTLFPDWFDWFEGQRHVANAVRQGLRLDYVSYRDVFHAGESLAPIAEPGDVAQRP